MGTGFLAVELCAEDGIPANTQMNSPAPTPKHRILVIDDNPAIHEDFRKILCWDRGRSTDLEAQEAELFGTAHPFGQQSEFEIDSAFQGEAGLARVYHAMQEGRPYSLAFVDVRMPPGWDGIEVTPKLWVADPHLPVVICTAYSDYSWEEMFARIGTSDRTFILKKPFDREEVLQIAHALTARPRPRPEETRPDAGRPDDLAHVSESAEMARRFREVMAGLKPVRPNQGP
jgi:CheY-like chemotaxis protein